MSGYLSGRQRRLQAAGATRAGVERRKAAADARSTEPHITGACGPPLCAECAAMLAERDGPPRLVAAADSLRRALDLENEPARFVARGEVQRAGGDPDRIEAAHKAALQKEGLAP